MLANEKRIMRTVCNCTVGIWKGLESSVATYNTGFASETGMEANMCSDIDWDSGSCPAQKPTLERPFYEVMTANAKCILCTRMCDLNVEHWNRSCRPLSQPEIVSGQQCMGSLELEPSESLHAGKGWSILFLLRYLCALQYPNPFISKVQQTMWLSKIRGVIIFPVITQLWIHCYRLSTSFLVEKQRVRTLWNLYV
jgi:hypothetical protein